MAAEALGAMRGQKAGEQARVGSADGKPAPRWARWVWSALLVGVELVHGGCPNVTLPPPPEPGTEPVSVVARSGLPQAQFSLELAGVPPGFSVTNGVYWGWALSSVPTVLLEAPQAVVLYDSYNPPWHLAVANLDLINYVLNHKQGHPADVQAAIGALAEGLSPWDLPVPGLDEAALAMVEEAFALGPGFVPAQAGQVTGVILDLGPGASPLLLEVAVPPNSAPVPGPDQASTISRIALVLPVAQLLANDTDPDGDSLSVVAVDAWSAQGGPVTWLGETIVYAPPVTPVGGYYSCFVGTDTFTYTVSDGKCGSAQGVVTVQVRPPNRPPTAGRTNLITWLNWPVRLAVSDLLALASDPDGDPLRITAVTAGINPPGATAALRDAVLLSLPPPDYLGVYQVRFTVADNRGGTAFGTVEVTVVESPLGLRVQAPQFNPVSGLFEQLVVISNAGPTNLPAVAVAVSGLEPEVRVVNATRLEAGIAFVQCNQPLAAGQTLRLRLEYYSPQPLTLTPWLAVGPAALAAAPAVPVGNGVRIDRCLLIHQQPGERRLGIEFGAVPGRTYTVLYSDDLRNWKAATPAFQAWADRICWFDDGPPKTESAPTSPGLRFYRLIETP